MTAPIDSNIIDLSIYQAQMAGAYARAASGVQPAGGLAEDESPAVPEERLPAVSMESAEFDRDLKTVNQAVALVQVSMAAVEKIRDNLDRVEESLASGAGGEENLAGLLEQIDRAAKTARYDDRGLLDGQGDEPREIFMGFPEAEGPDDPVGETVSKNGRPVTLAFTGPDGAVRPLVFSPEDNDRLGDMALRVDAEFGETVDAKWDDPGGIRVADKNPGNSHTAMSLVRDAEVIRRSETLHQGGLSRVSFEVSSGDPQQSVEITRHDLTVSGLGLDPPTPDALKQARGQVDGMADELATHFAHLTQTGLAITEKALDHSNTPELSDAATAFDLSRFTSSRIRADAAGAVVTQANTSSGRAASLLG